MTAEARRRGGETVPTLTSNGDAHTGFRDEHGLIAVGINGAEAVAHSLRADGFDAGEDGTGRGTPLVPEVVGCLSDGAHNGGGLNGQDAYTGRILPTAGMAVRRLTPRECERLQGFPDDWTAVTFRGKPAADGPRYKALGNSMAVNVMRWIGERIAEVDGLPTL